MTKITTDLKLSILFLIPATLLALYAGILNTESKDNTITSLIAIILAIFSMFFILKDIKKDAKTKNRGT